MIHLTGVYQTIKKQYDSHIAFFDSNALSVLSVLIKYFIKFTYNVTIRLITHLTIT